MKDSPRRPRGRVARRADLLGTWRIVEMDLWDPEDIDLVGPAFIEFTADRMGHFRFIAVKGWMDCRHQTIDDRPHVDFTWVGVDEEDEVSGRGWARQEPEDSLRGHLYIHLGDDSGFRAVRADKG